MNCDKIETESEDKMVAELEDKIEAELEDKMEAELEDAEVPTDWSFKGKINKSDPVIVIKLLEFFVKEKFMMSYNKLPAQRLKNIIKELKQHNITNYSERNQSDRKKFHTNVQSWIRALVNTLAKPEDGKDTSLLNLIDGNEKMFKLLGNKINIRTGNSSKMTEALQKKLKSESRRLKIIALCSKLLYTEVLDLPQRVSSVEPIPENYRKRGTGNLNLREPHPKKKKSLLSTIDCAAIKIFKAAAPSPKKIIDSVDVVGVMNYFLYLHRICALNDEDYEILTEKFERALEIKIANNNNTDLAIFYNKLVIYSASLSEDKVKEKMNSYFDIIINDSQDEEYDF